MIETPSSLKDTSSDKQPDGMVRLHDCDLVFDVRGIDPLSPSHTKRNANKPTAAEDDAAKDKTNKYMYLHSFNRSIEFFPFVYSAWLEGRDPLMKNFTH